MARFVRSVSWSTLAAVAIGLLMTLLAVLKSDSQIQAEARQQYTRFHERMVNEVESRATLPVYGLKGARGVFAASKSVERGEFAAYVASRNLQAEFPGVIGFGFIQRVARKDIAAYQAAARADDGGGFTVDPPATDLTGPDCWVVKYFSPAANADDCIGKDLVNRPGRLEALMRAVRSGEPAMSESVGVLDRGKEVRGYLCLVPVYRNGTHPKTESEREVALDGVLFAPIALERVMAAARSQAEGMVGYEVVNESAAAEDGGDEVRPDEKRRGEGARFETTTAVPIGGTIWHIRTWTTARFEDGVSHVASNLLGVGGLAVTAMMGVLLWVLTNSRDQATALSKRMTGELEETSEVLRRTSALAQVGGWTVDLKTWKVEWSEEVFRIHGVEGKVVPALQEWTKLYAPEARDSVNAAIEESIKYGTPWDCEWPLVPVQGAQIWVRSQGECLYEDGAPVKLCGAVQDITERKLATEALRLQAMNDKLTGLPNRASLHDAIEKALSTGRRSTDGHFAILFLDFDRFKQINDTLGHEAGDDLLRNIATRLRKTLRATDSPFHNDECVAGRLGGDEFVVLLDGLKSPRDAVIVAERLLRVFAEPHMIAGHEVVSTASIGLVTNEHAYENADEMLRDADAAMYEAKVNGKGRWVEFDVSMREKLAAKIKMEEKLRTAIEQNELFVMYEPVVSLETGKLEGVQGMAQWRMSDGRCFEPCDFFPIAESSGVMLPIAHWMLRRACEDFVGWQRTLGDQCPGMLNLTLTQLQLSIADFPRTLAEVLEETGMPAEKLCFEVTELASAKDVAAGGAGLQAIKATGVKLALDDFGIKRSSLTSLHAMPIDVLKLDRSLVENIEDGAEVTSLVQAVMHLARNKKIAVIAGGVETADQIKALQRFECAMAQGLVFSGPVSAREVEALAVPGRWSAVAVTRKAA